ncbi:hypothetical protein AMR72_16705 [Flavobacterium psychrophilum]|nr:hypothetical protein AMR72_16705 [Flavobacterium psychrophilum]AOE53996.1 hypothetical protein ALW18_16695 [Flavobacterium psychrophilum]
MQKLITYVKSLAGFSPELWETLLPALSKKTFAKGELLLAAGEVCNSLFFIEEGFVRAFHIADGAEVNTSLHFDGEIVTNNRSYSTGEKSGYNIEASEPVTAIVFDKAKLIEAGAEMPEIAILGKNCLSYTAARMEEYADIFNLYTPTERYEHIARTNPHILQRVPLTVLASYLGMGRESLNRVRRKRQITDVKI